VFVGVYRGVIYADGLCCVSGALCYKAMFLPHPPNCAVAKASETISDDTNAYSKAVRGNIYPDLYALLNGLLRFPLFAEGGKIVMGPTLKHKDLLGDSSWAFARNLVDKTYFEIDN
jgi:hypothetical protein